MKVKKVRGAPNFDGFRRRTAAGLVLAVILLSQACASASRQFDRAATGLGLARETRVAGSFNHALYWPTGPTVQAETLHVYLDGDGRPWRGERISPDPTPVRPLVLRLLVKDSLPSVYLGRPCYHDERTAACHPLLWTALRYSEPVVASMAQVVVELVAERRVQQVVLIGYSGGGTLAMLLAERVPEVVGVITVAANLDVERWAALHGYSPLTRSLDPATRPSLRASVRQLHWVGDMDRVVPAALIEPTVDRQPNAELRIVKGFDHACCWEDIWPEVLARLGGD